MRIEDCAEKHFHCFITMYLPSKIYMNLKFLTVKNFSEIPNTINKQHKVNEFQN